MTSLKMAPLLRLSLVFVAISMCRAQKNVDIDSLINSIFTKGPDVEPSPSPTKTTVLNPTPPMPKPSAEPKGNIPYKSCGYEKECVPRYLCKDDTLNVGGIGVIDIRIDGETCDYLETCCDIPNKTDKPLIDPVPPETHTGCGFRNPEGVGFRITGDKDQESQFGEFPWMAAILSDELIAGEILNVYECGSAIIAPNVVLTAAHCVQALDPKTLVVRAGEWDTQTKSEILPHQDQRVQEIIVHEKYHKGALYNDIALLILNRPFVWDENVRPICLPDSTAIFDHSRCYVTGWGKDKFGKDGQYQVILKKIDVPVVPNNQCEQNLRSTRLGRYFQLHQSFICAGGEKGKDACKGDGGSPLVCPDPANPKRYYQAGIVAWGIGCGGENIPGVYANVPFLRQWINEKLSARGVDFSSFTA